MIVAGIVADCPVEVCLPVGLALGSLRGASEPPTSPYHFCISGRTSLPNRPMLLMVAWCDIFDS